MNKKPKSVFVEGPISSSFIGEGIARHSAKTSIGAHSIFLGQVRKDTIDGREVEGIDYSAYAEMADELLHTIREEAFTRFDLTCMHIYHSLGMVKCGEICLFVFASSGHRPEAFDACRWIVEEIKAKVPVWGKEYFKDNTYVWKKDN